MLPRRPELAPQERRDGPVPRDDDARTMEDLAHDPAVIANRARLARLRELRAPGPLDVGDALHGSAWFLVVLVVIAAAGRVLLELGIVWAAAASAVVDVLLLLTFASVLEHQERRMIRACGHRVADTPGFHWRLLTPGSVVRRIRAHLAALNIDDSELEDAHELMCRHGADNYDFRPSESPASRRRHSR